jgi:AbrB family looped-hinge helix DNA binding protein
MRATGIVRRVDDLGRIVIPKEIRRSMGIREGEPLEIYLENDAVIFRRYSYNLVHEIERVAELIECNCNADRETMADISRMLSTVAELVKADEECED